MAELSAVFIVGENEPLLSDSVESIRPFAEEIILADCAGDRSERIDLPDVQVLRFEWVNDFSSARNFSISKATKDIIFVIDADEMVSKTDADAFESIKQLDPSRTWGLVLPARNYFSGDVFDIGFCRNSGEYPEMEKGSKGYAVSEKVRVFPNRKNIFFENRIHETVEKSLLRLHGELRTPGRPVIHHFGYLREKERSLSKQQKYGAMLLEELKEKPESFKTLFDCGHHFFLAGDFEKALPLFRRAYAISQNEAAAFYAGAALLRLEKYSEALESLSAMKDRSPAVRFHIAEALRISGKPQEAVPLLRSALRDLPGNVNILKSLGESYLQAGSSRQAKHCFEKIRELSENKKEKH